MEEGIWNQAVHYLPSVLGGSIQTEMKCGTAETDRRARERPILRETDPARAIAKRHLLLSLLTFLCGRSDRQWFGTGKDNRVCTRLPQPCCWHFPLPVLLGPLGNG